MTVPAAERKAGPFIGNGSTTAFPFTFKVFTTADIEVVFANSYGVETVLTLDSDYSVSLNADQDAAPGGTVNYPLSGTALSTEERLAVVGALSYEQETDIPTGGNFNPTVLESALDRLAIQNQQLAEAVSRAYKVPVASPLSPDDLIAALTEASELASDSAASALASLTELTGIYYGTLAADPATDPWGAAPTAGDLYANSVSNTMRVYTTAAGWIDAVAPMAVATQQFSGNGSQVAFTLSAAPASSAACHVQISGIGQVPDVDYGAVGTTLTFTTAPPTGTNNIFVRTFTAASIGVPSDGSVAPAKLSTGAPKWDVNSKVGIRTASPQKDLHIVGASATAPVIRLENTDTSVIGNEDYGVIEFFGNDASTNANGVRASMVARSSDTAGRTELRFFVSNSSSTAAYLALNLTAGTSTFYSGLQVTGGLLVSGAAALYGDVLLGNVRRVYGQVNMVNTDTQIDVDLTTYFTQSIQSYSTLKCTVAGVYTDNTSVPTYAGSARLHKVWDQGITWNGTTWVLNGAALVGTAFNSDATNFPAGAVNAAKALMVVSATQVLLRLQNRTTPAVTSGTIYQYNLEQIVGL